MVLQYQQTKDPVVFGKILKRVDALIIRVISSLKKRTLYIKDVELEELYQIGILGVYAATKTSPTSEKAEKFPLRIASYIESNIRLVFEYRSKKEVINQEKFNDKDFCFEKDNLSIEFFDLLDIMTQMYIRKQLSYDEVKLLYDRFFKQQSFASLEHSYGISHEWIRLKIIKILRRIRKFSEK